jgi:hypothetical protein
VACRRVPRAGPRQPERDRADLPHAGGDAGFLLELDVEIGGILREPRHVLGAAQLAHQTGGVPGRAAGQLLAFQKDDVGPAELGQVIGDRTAGDAATDDDGAGMRLGRAAMGSGPQPVVAGVPQGPIRLHDGGAAFAEDVDLQLIAGHARSVRSMPERDRLPTR